MKIIFSSIPTSRWKHKKTVQLQSKLSTGGELHVTSEQRPWQLWSKESLSQDNRVVCPQWNLIGQSLFSLASTKGFGAGNRSCVSLPPGSASGSPAREWRNRARPLFFFLLSVYMWLCPWEKGKEKERVCWDVWKHSANLCVHMLAQRKESHIFRSSILIPPDSPSSPSSTSLQLFIRHIIDEYKQRWGAFSCAAARLWSASLPIPRILSANEGTNEQSLR